MKLFLGSPSQCHVWNNFPICIEKSAPRLSATVRVLHGSGMFLVTEADAAAIRAAYEQVGELSAVVELRRRFPGITDNAHARRCARSIVGWTPAPEAPCTVTRLRPGKRRKSDPS